MKTFLLIGFYPSPYSTNSIKVMHMVKALRQYGFKVFVVPLLGKENKTRLFDEKICTPISIDISENSFYQRPGIF